MAEQTTATPATAKPLTVAENMDARRIFPNVGEAVNYLMASATRFTDFAETPVAMPGIIKGEDGEPEVNEDGSPKTDPAVYSKSMDVMVSVLKKQGAGAKAIVVAPIPKVDVLLDSDAGRAWVSKILHKELNHVAVRHLRDAEDVLNFVDQMPTTVEGYITSERGTGGIMETFDALQKGINDAFSQKLPNWAKRRFIKSELKKALESKAYALEFYADIEDYKGRSLFVDALDVGIAAAKRKGLDPTIFERWKATRDSKAFTAAEEEDEEELNLDSLTDALLAETGEAKPAEPAAAEPTEGQPAAEQPTGDESEEAQAEGTPEEPVTA